MISLYARLAGQWDKLFPPDEKRQAFLADRFEEYRNSGFLVEVGCGTAATAAFLAARGYDVLATDLDPQMIEIAESRSRPGLELRVADMNETLQVTLPGSSDAVLCLGNTIPHLPDLNALRNFFSEASRVLRPGGQLIIQILNYQRIKKAGVLHMPDLKGDRLVFKRSQSWSADINRVQFTTEVCSGDKSETREHLMQALTDKQLSAAANDVGLLLTEQGSDWSGTPVQPDSPWFYLIYRKGS